MLREVLSKHIKPRIIAFRAVFTASSTTTKLSYGYGDAVLTRTSTGRGSFTLKQGYTRNGLIFLSTNTAAGGACITTASTPTPSIFDLQNKNTSGTATAGTADGFCYGWNSSDLSICRGQNVASSQGASKIIWGKITGATGVVSIGAKDFSCNRSATGVYDITFLRAFGATPVIKVTTISTTLAKESISVQTAAGCTVSIWNSAAGAADSDFYIMAIGSNSTADSARGRYPLQNSQRKPRIIAGQVGNVSGTLTLSIGGATGGADFNTLVDNGPGDFSLTIAEAFPREAAVFTTGIAGPSQVHSVSGSTFRLVQHAFAGGGADSDGPTNFFIIGSDDVSEY